MEDQVSRRFKQMILKLGRLVKPDELNTLKFLCKDIIPTKYREKIKTIEELFEMLEERGRVSPRDLTYLRQLLQDGLPGRTDVLNVVAEYEHGAVSSPDIDSVRISGLHIHDFNQQIQFLEENLGREFKSFFRRLGVEDHQIERREIENPRNVREVIHQCMLVWLHDNRHLQHAHLKTLVVAALKKERRNDLAKKFEAGTLE